MPNPIKLLSVPTYGYLIFYSSKNCDVPNALFFINQKYGHVEMISGN